jgi:peptidoglycan/xylan/chitin deacetylase (PgdA/CDA1 family)
MVSASARQPATSHRPRRPLDALRRPPLVIAYHGVGVVAREHDPAHLMVAPDLLRSQLRTLRRRGYEFLKITEFAARIEGGRGPAGCCALTFDDGSSDNLGVLPAILAEFGATATVFACPGLLGEPHFSIDPAAGVRLLTAEELRELAGLESIEIGSHTSRHTLLGEAGAERAFEVMDGSRRELEDLLGRPVTSFAYPACEHSAACREAARRAGYSVAATCAPKGGWDPLELTRESVSTLDGGLTFALKIHHLWEPLYDSAAGRVASRLARRARHGDG